MEVKEMPIIYSAGLWATRRWFKKNSILSQRLKNVQGEIYLEFGLKSRLAAAFVGPWILYRLAKEQKRLKAGITYEPPTFYETSVRAVRPRKAGTAAA